MTPCHAAADDQKARPSLSEHTIENYEPKRSISVNYQRYAKSFVSLCLALEQDGRRTLVYNLVVQRDYRDPACLGCKSYFAEFHAACMDEKFSQLKKAAKKLRNKASATPSLAPDDSTPSPTPSVTATPTPVVKQREPSIAVIESAAEIANELAEDERIREYNRQVVNIMLGLFLLPQNVSVAEKEYLARLAAIFSDAFAQYPEPVEDDDHSPEGGKAHAPPAQTVDDLFK